PRKPNSSRVMYPSRMWSRIFSPYPPKSSACRSDTAIRHSAPSLLSESPSKYSIHSPCSLKPSRSTSYSVTSSTLRPRSVDSVYRSWMVTLSMMLLRVSVLSYYFHLMEKSLLLPCVRGEQEHLVLPHQAGARKGATHWST